MQTRNSTTSLRLIPTTFVALAAFTLATGAQAQSAFGGSPTKTAPSSSTVPATTSSSTSKDAATLDAAFVRADVNTDGALSPQEASRLPAIAAKFAELDKNGDGLLSKVEFSTGYLAAP